MVRTQVYLTEIEKQALRTLCHRTGHTQSELIRQAVDSLIAQAEKIDSRALLQQARGLWQHRNDLPDFVSLRHEWDRLALHDE